PNNTNAADKQDLAISTDTHKQETGKNSPIDNSHISNKTALKAIEKNITLFKDRIRERFSVWLERSAKYMEIMKEILREKNLPEELVFLPIVESGFNLNAYSKARAVGPWQFIASTGKRYGLVIDWWRDERKDPVKSTMAAADYLKDLYKMFGSWNLALAAYNAGEGRISKALKRTDSDDYWALLNTKQIRNETKEYVPRYIAATMIASTPEEYGFNNLDYHEPLEYDEVTIQSPLDIDVIAKCAEATEKEIRELNPELRRWSTPLNVSKYTIRIPAGSKEIFLKNISDIPKEDHFTVDTYTVRKGDTIKKVAKKTGIPVNAIIAMNSLSGIEHLSAGDKINLPPKEKYYPDLDDKSLVHKASYKKKSGDKKTGRKGKKGSRKTQRAKSKVKTKKA
ncbi:MAG: transglycosylase SLT domain-containing protein, partial [Nitrospirae bacterium]|nr:transglycosylase SLT domain-containing protein [Nitrospirota bacterium]